MSSINNMDRDHSSSLNS